MSCYVCNQTIHERKYAILRTEKAFCNSINVLEIILFAFNALINVVHNIHCTIYIVVNRFKGAHLLNFCNIKCAQIFHSIYEKKNNNFIVFTFTSKI